MLGRLFERGLTVGNVWGHATPSAPWGLWPGDPGYGNSGDAMQLTTVLGCVRLISDQISTLPVDVFRKVGDTRVEVSAPDWLEEPMVGVDFPSWCSQVVTSLLMDGNAYILIGRRDTGGIVELRPIDPAMVRVEQGRYTINGKPAPELVHIRGLMLPGAEKGLNPISYARLTVGLGLSALKYGADFFDGDGNMPGVIELPHPAYEGQKENLALQWQRKRRKGGKGLPGVIDNGGTWKPTSVSNEDAQFLDTRKWTSAEICQLFLVDPSELGIPVEGSNLTYSNLQDRNTRRVQVTLRPWIVRVESALSALLSSPRYMRFNVDALLRGSLTTQMDIFDKGVRAGILTPNEPRQWMNLDPIPDGDQALWPPGRAFPVETDQPQTPAA